MSEITWTAERGAAIIEEIETVIVGKRQAVETIVVGLLCSGHILIEDIPGVGKTMLAKALAGALGATYRRIQFTPDLLPADVTGTSIFNQKTGEFAFRQGPVFTNVLLADEINRATPKTQSSLLECMEEFQVTVDGATHTLDRPFFVIATENPIEYRGTYPLPEAQLDRFLMRVSIGYPTAEEEIIVLDRQVKEHPIKAIKAVVSREEVLRMQESVKDVHIDPSLKQYMVQLVAKTRNHPMLALGASPRASLGLMRTGQALAALQGREFVLPDDIKGLAASVLCHRLILKPEARVRQADLVELVAELVDSVPVPVVN
ncbi:MAG: MoxR family ATPase [Armatimonadetes bacterium]|nr:MoxR family ATPase [Armatimonadota bacterium]